MGVVADDGVNRAGARTAMRRMLRTAPVHDGARRGWGGAAGGPVVERWRHGAVHTVLTPMREHVVMAYFDTPRRIEAACLAAGDRTPGGRPVRAVTDNDAVTVIPAGTLARWDVWGDVDAVHLYLPPDRLARLAARAGLPAPARLVEAVAAPRPRLVQLMRLLAHELERSAWPAGDAAASGGVRALDAGATYADAVADLVGLELLREHVDDASDAEADGVAPSSSAARDARENARDPGAGLTRWQVRRATAYLVQRLDRAVPLAEVAADLGLSPKHFCTAFRLATGLPPHAWARQQRVERARALLAEGRLPLTEIAFRLGYASHSAFAAAFRRETGQTPSAWRRASAGTTGTERM